MKTLSHVASRLTDRPMMLWPPKLIEITGAVGDRLGLDPVEVAAALREAGVSAADIRAGMFGPSADDRNYEVIDGIAVIPVQGTLMKKTSGLQALSGCASYLDIQSQIASAIEDAGVKGILLDIDSPGGETNGCFELSDYIYSVRGQKPIHAVANDCALSAAYAIASAASHITVTRTGAVGSIGVYALHAEQTEFDAKLGVKYTYLFAGQKKVDGNPHQPLSERAAKDTQDEVDREYGIFTETVARNRGVDVKEIIATQAGLLWAENSIPLLADQVGTLADAMNLLVGSPSSVPRAAAAAIQPQGVSMTKLEQLALDNRLAAAKPTEEPEAKSEEPQPKCTTDPEDDEDQTGKEDEEDVADAKSKKAAAPIPGRTLKALPASAVRSEGDIAAIGALCKMAGVPEKAVDFLTAKTAKGEFLSVAEVSEQLTAARVEASEQLVINSNVNPNKSAASGIQAIEAEAAAFARQNKGVTKEQAFARMLEANPEAYASYRNQHNTKGLIQTLQNAGFKLVQG